MKNLLRLFVVALAVAGCGQQRKARDQRTAEATEQEQTPTKPTSFTKDEIAKFTISSVMNQPPSIMSIKAENGIYVVSYRRPSDGQHFEYKIKFEGANKVIWGSRNGRWRDTRQDEQITYREQGDQLIITQTFEDGSTINKEFE